MAQVALAREQTSNNGSRQGVDDYTGLTASYTLNPRLR